MKLSANIQKAPKQKFHKFNRKTNGNFCGLTKCKKKRQEYILHVCKIRFRIPGTCNIKAII